MHNLNVKIIGPSSFVSTLNELKVFLKFNSILNNTNDDPNIILFHTDALKDKKLKEYIDWSEAYVKHSPYLFIYYDLATAYESLGNSKKAWQVYNLAKYLYPGALWRDKIQ